MSDATQIRIIPVGINTNAVHGPEEGGWSGDLYTVIPGEQYEFTDVETMWSFSDYLNGESMEGMLGTLPEFDYLEFKPMFYYGPNDWRNTYEPSIPAVAGNTWGDHYE